MRMRLLSYVLPRGALIAALVPTFFALHAAQACDWPPMPAASELLKPKSAALARLAQDRAFLRDAALFVGRVVSIESSVNENRSATTFQVMKVVKGDLPGTISLSGAMASGGDCSLPLRVDQVALFLIYRNSEGEWTTGLPAHPGQDVSRTALLNYAKKR